MRAQKPWRMQALREMTGTAWFFGGDGVGRRQTSRHFSQSSTQAIGDERRGAVHAEGDEVIVVARTSAVQESLTSDERVGARA